MNYYIDTIDLSNCDVSSVTNMSNKLSILIWRYLNVSSDMGCFFGCD
ncbi:MAG: hypothetical protein JKY48_16345 [Flavobacteriales bacterium]|nr:hypothetical protein [Flavobacteriales bacterium]